jgi:hypothetical protein
MGHDFALAPDYYENYEIWVTSADGKQHPISIDQDRLVLSADGTAIPFAFQPLDLGKRFAMSLQRTPAQGGPRSIQVDAIGLRLVDTTASTLIVSPQFDPNTKLTTFFTSEGQPLSAELDKPVTLAKTPGLSSAFRLAGVQRPRLKIAGDVHHQINAPGGHRFEPIVGSGRP